MNQSSVLFKNYSALTERQIEERMSLSRGESLNET